MSSFDFDVVTGPSLQKRDPAPLRQRSHAGEAQGKTETAEPRTRAAGAKSPNTTIAPANTSG